MTFEDMFRDFFFSEKSSPQPQALPWTLFFSHCPTLTIISVCYCYQITDKSDYTYCNHYTEYNGKPIYPVQQLHPCSGGTEITPSGNSLTYYGIFRAALTSQRWKYPHMPKRSTPLEIPIRLNGKPYPIATHVFNGIIKESITLLNFSTMFWTLYKFWKIFIER